MKHSKLPSFSVGEKACAQKAVSFSFLLNELENMKGFAPSRVEVHLGFVFDTTAVKATLHHNCFLPPFRWSSDL